MSMAVRSYETVSWNRLWITLTAIAGIFAIGLWNFLSRLRTGTYGWPEIGFFAVFALLLYFAVVSTLTAAREIVVHEGDEIEFVSRMGRTRISARDIRSVKLRQGRQYQIVVEHSDGKIYLAGAMNDFHQFLTDLQQANPAVRTIGC
jgi:hypothetical protein